jgi:site-specific DNA-methyltransferase (adenine-specific)
MHKEQPFQLQPPDSPSVPDSARTSAPHGTLDLRLGDCMDLMRDTPDGFYDLAIVDPPYGIGAGQMTMGRGSRNDTGKHTAKPWDKTAPPPKYFDELRRVSLSQIIWGGNYFPLPPSRCWLLWDKMYPNSDFAAAEMAWTSFDRVVKKFEMSRKAASLAGGIHPTQKPVALYNWLLANYAKPGQRILDTHLGSGSIAIACHYFGAHLTATEIDPDYYAAAVERIQRETRQLGLL